MGDLISSSLLAGAAGRAAPSPGAVRGRAVAAGDWLTRMWPPPAFAECPAFDTRTDDQVPNSPRRTSIAPSSGASLRICTSRAMMSRFMAPKLHELQEVRQPVAQELRPRRREMNVVFDPHAAVARQVHARLDRHDRARRQRIVV